MNGSHSTGPNLSKYSCPGVGSDPPAAVSVPPSPPGGPGGGGLQAGSSSTQVGRRKVIPLVTTPPQGRGPPGCSPLCGPQPGDAQPRGRAPGGGHCLPGAGYTGTESDLSFPDRPGLGQAAGGWLRGPGLDQTGRPPRHQGEQAPISYLLATPCPGKSQGVFLCPPPCSGSRRQSVHHQARYGDHTDWWLPLLSR